MVESRSVVFWGLWYEGEQKGRIAKGHEKLLVVIDILIILIIVIISEMYNMSNLIELNILNMYSLCAYKAVKKQTERKKLHCDFFFDL